MIQLIWHLVMKSLGLFDSSIKKRRGRVNQRWGTPPERLEIRDLLSGMRVVPQAANVAGFWSINVIQNGITTPGDLTLTQSGNGGKHVTGTVHAGTAILNISGNLRFNSTELKGKAVIRPTPGVKSVNGKFDIVFFDGFTTFTGDANFKKLGQNPTLNGVKLMR